MFTADDTGRADYPLLQNGPINLFWRKSLFASAVTSLKALGYSVVGVGFTSLDAFHDEVSGILKWKEQFGHDRWNGNLDAFNDGLRGEPFNSADDIAFCIEDFHLLVKEDPDTAHAVLDIIAGQSRSYALFGKRLIGLIQTNDPNFSTDRLGGTAAHWNRAEWLNSNRGA